MNNLLLNRRLKIQLLILLLHNLYKISAAGLSSLGNYFGNVSYYYIMFVLPKYIMRVYFIHPHHYILENNAFRRGSNPHRRISVFSIPENSLQNIYS